MLLPLMGMLLFGFFWVGSGFLIQYRMTNAAMIAARTAASRAALADNIATIQGDTQTFLQNMIGDKRCEAGISTQSGSATVPSAVTVTVSCPIPMPFLSSILPNRARTTASAPYYEVVMNVPPPPI